MNIISIQSHVAYGYVGNKSATFPLQSLGFDVWPIHTVQFSNHTGYGKWKGEIFSAAHIQSVCRTLEAFHVATNCHAILSGYIGEEAVGATIFKMVERFRSIYPKLIYLCDPVMGDTIYKKCFVQQGIPDLFQKQSLKVADIITPNHFEAEILATTVITTVETLKQACAFFHGQGGSIVIITSLNIEGIPHTEDCCAFLSVQGGPQWWAITPHLPSIYPIHGAGDLLAAVYLGHFLLSQDPVVAFQYAIATVYQVIKATVEAQQQELKIIGHRFDAIDLNSVRLIPMA